MDFGFVSLCKSYLIIFTMLVLRKKTTVAPSVKAAFV